MPKIDDSGNYEAITVNIPIKLYLRLIKIEKRDRVGRDKLVTDALSEYFRGVDPLGRKHWGAVYD